MYQTIDNNASIVEGTYGVVVPYWKSHPAEDGTISRHYVAYAAFFPHSARNCAGVLYPSFSCSRRWL